MGKISDIVYYELQTTQKLSYNGDNFLIWKTKLSFVLTDHGFPHLLNPNPSDPASNEPNDFARSLILRTLDDVLFVEFAKLPTPASVMGSLLGRFGSRLKAFATMKLRSYMDYRMPTDAHINQHIFRMRAMAKELQYGCGIKLPEEMHAVILLNSLPAGWEEDVEGLVRILDGDNENLSVDSISRRLRALQDARKLKKFMDGEKLKRRFKGHCYKCGGKGHYRSDCPVQGSSKQKSSPQSSDIPIEIETASEMIYLSLKTEKKIDYEGLYFFMWKKLISHILEEWNVEYVLKEPKPHEPTDSAPEEDRDKKWRADDFTCRHIILGTMEDDVFLSFHDYPTAKALMDALEAFFDFSSAARKLLCLKKYMNHRMAEHTPIDDHINKMDTLVWKLSNAGLNIPSEMESIVLMDSLPKSWDETVSMLYASISSDEKNGWDIDHVRHRVMRAGQIMERYGSDK